MEIEKLHLNQLVYHTDVYWGREQMKIVGIRENEVELEGDWSGGTNNVCQRSWMPVKGILLMRQNHNVEEITPEDAYAYKGHIYHKIRDISVKDPESRVWLKFTLYGRDGEWYARMKYEFDERFVKLDL